MNIFNKKGFNFIEIIIFVVIAILIFATFSQLFSLSVDLPFISDRSKALYYAQKEIEKLNNTPYSNILTILRTNYPDDTNYDYEIIVNENSPQNNKKDVFIRFYFKDKPQILVELFSKFIKLEKVELCEDFQDRNWTAPPWNWTRNPKGQWDIIEYPNNSQNYRAYYARRQSGFIYPDWAGSSNYTLSVDFYLTSFLLNYSIVRFYGRYNNTTDNGYFVEVRTYNIWLIDEYTYFYLYKVVNGVNTLLDQYYLDYSIFNNWHNIKLEMMQNKINVYFDGGQTPIITAIDNQFTSGSIRVSVESQSLATPVYFDNICVKEVD